MAKRTYLKGGEARKINRVVRFSEAEAELLGKVADAVGQSDSEFVRRLVLSVVMNAESTGAILNEGDEIKVVPSLFGPMIEATKVEAGEPA
jgi:hypothetical protein